LNIRLLQLASPSLPVGAYSYSQGLEAAVEAGLVTNAASARRWIGDVLVLSMGGMEAPVLLRLIAAWKERDSQAAARWNAELVASRESAELRAETLQMGYSLRNLLRDLGEDLVLDPREQIGREGLAALKSVPLGQTDGQRVLLELGGRIAAIVEGAASSSDDDLTNLAPGLALLSARHETQYSRIFRS
jgi:urease accessory protein